MGIIKKLLGRELVGWSDSSSTEVYPITHVGAVYDSNGKTLEEVIDDIQQQIINGTGGGGSSASVYPINYLWAYKAASDTPSLDTTEEALCPTGWSQTPVTPGENQDLYMTTARKQGSIYLKWSGSSVWSSPVRISGGGGTSDTGADGDGYNYIYCLTTTENRPNLPSTITVDAVEQYEGTQYGISTGGSRSSDRINVWRDHPHGVASDAGFEWIAVAKSDNGTWRSYSTPVLWSKYGFDGKDGDTIEYIYKLTSANTTPTLSAPYSGRIGENGTTTYSNVGVSDSIYQNDDFIPSDWHDNPQSLTVDYPVQWVSVRKQNNGVWEVFSTPTKWSENSITRTVVDAPYIMTNNNPWMGVVCTYDGNPIISDGNSYGSAQLRVFRDNVNVTDAFTWSRSNCSSTNVNYNMSSVTTQGSDKYVTIYPYTISADQGEINIKAVNGDVEVTTKITVVKIKATEPGTIPIGYSFNLSSSFAIKTENGFVAPIEVDVIKSYNGESTPLTSLTAIQNEGLTISVKENNSWRTITDDNVLDITELAGLFPATSQIGDKVELRLTKGTSLQDYAYITMISAGGTTIINNNTYESDDYIFSLARNNSTVALTGVYNTDNTMTPRFDPSSLDYKIVGVKKGQELDVATMQSLFPTEEQARTNNIPIYWFENPTGNCTPSIVHTNDGVYIHLVPTSVTRGGSVTINCYRDSNHTDFWGTLVASYNLEKSSYTITQDSRGLGLNGLSDLVNSQGQTLETHESLLTHTSKQLTSTIESQYVFPNLFGFSNGLTFDNSEPFIQAYGAEIVPGSIPSKITGFNVDTTQKIVVSMDTYRSGSGTYTCTAKFNNVAPTELTINGERIEETNGFTLTYGSQQHVVMYFENLSSEVEGLQFEISAGNNNRMMLFNLKVEYGYTPTKFCISDEDAAVNNNPDLLDTMGETTGDVLQDKDISVRKQSVDTGTTFTGSIEDSGVITIADTSVGSYSEMVLAKNILPIPALGTTKLYTLSFTAKASAANTHIKSYIFTNAKQIGTYTYRGGDGVCNDEQGLTINTLDTEWKRCYARFYVSATHSLSDFLRPVIVGAQNDVNPVYDFANKEGGTRTVWVKDIVFQEGYTPSDDQVISDNAHTKSLINQTSEGITLEVSNKLKTTGIDIDTNQITLNGNTLVNGMLTLNSDEGFILNNTDGSPGAIVKAGEIPTFSDWINGNSGQLVRTTGFHEVTINGNNYSDSCSIDLGNYFSGNKITIDQITVISQNTITGNLTCSLKTSNENIVVTRTVEVDSGTPLSLQPFINVIEFTDFEHSLSENSNIEIQFSLSGTISSSENPIIQIGVESTIEGANIGYVGSDGIALRSAAGGNGPNYSYLGSDVTCIVHDRYGLKIDATGISYSTNGGNDWHSLL